MAICRAVAALQACSGAEPNQSVKAACEYGTIASRTDREAPGVCTNAAIAPLPPPVAAITNCRPLA